MQAKAGECCAWSRTSTIHKYADGIDKNTDAYLKHEFCHTTVESIVSGAGVCCFNVGSTSYGDCDERLGTGPAIQDIYDFIGSEPVWLTAFHESWTMATENGYSTLYTPEIGDDVDDVVEPVGDKKPKTVEDETCEDLSSPLTCFTDHMDDLIGCIMKSLGCMFE